MVDEQLPPAGASMATLVAPARSHSTVARLVFGLMLWVFGLPGAVLLTSLVFVAPNAASAWAWIFAGFWVLVAAAGRAVDLAVGDTR